MLLVVMSPQALLDCDSQTFLVVKDLVSYQEYVQIVIFLELSDVCLMVRLGLWIFWGKTTEVKCQSHHAELKVQTINISYH